MKAFDNMKKIFQIILKTKKILYTILLLYRNVRVKRWSEKLVAGIKCKIQKETKIEAFQRKVILILAACFFL